ncbi:MAG: GxxExxY protein [Candidatus Marinimicrobia bacterium]|nr:GxxExxY protein [Candidatus Neomarinimicrobiota bacterium]MCF7903574.1 GxxExxY protein [Candidatus Neomarinimicrobiota bacterium]
MNHFDITKDIIGAAFEVHNELGYGFLERVYQKSLQVELRKRGHDVKLEPALDVRYKGVTVGKYLADLLVDGQVIVELKVSKEYNKQDEAQLLNELKASKVSVGLLINFGRQKVQFKRFVF